MNYRPTSCLGRSLFTLFMHFLFPMNDESCNVLLRKQPVCNNYFQTGVRHYNCSTEFRQRCCKFYFGYLAVSQWFTLYRSGSVWHGSLCMAWFTLYRSGSAILELKLFHCFFCSGNGSSAHCCEAIKLPAIILLHPLLRCCRRGPS